MKPVLAVLLTLVFFGGGMGGFSLSAPEKLGNAGMFGSMIMSCAMAVYWILVTLKKKKKSAA